MERIRKVSGVSDEETAAVTLPAALSPDLRAAAVRLITRAEAMGLIASDDLLTFSSSTLDAAMKAFRKVGIGRGIARPTEVDQDLRSALDLMNSVVENSPHPDTEWDGMLGVLAPDTLANLLGISDSSLRRYSTRERPTPQQVAVRLHWLALRVADLAGAYNHYGIVRWFQRPRRALGGQSPAQRLAGEWTPDDHQITQVAELAASLTAMSAT